MAQKPIKAAGKKAAPKKAAAANRHGKIAKTKKGNLTFEVKRAALRPAAKEERELTKAINAQNEQRFAGVAAQRGGKLGVVRPPVAATADEKQRGAAAKRPAPPPNKK